MGATTAKEFEDLLENAFADALGFTRDEWATIESISRQMIEAGAFKADATKCAVSAFILWFEWEGYRNADNVPPELT